MTPRKIFNIWKLKTNITFILIKVTNMDNCVDLSVGVLGWG